MKKFKLSDLLRIRTRMDGQETQLMKTIELLAKLVDRKLYKATLKLDLKKIYVAVLGDICDHTENEDYEKAQEALYLLAVLMDHDARFVLEHMVYLNKRSIQYFFQYFCEYLANTRMIDLAFLETEMSAEFVEIEKTLENETDESRFSLE